MPPSEPLHPLVAEWDADVLGGDPLGFPGYAPPDEESVVTGRTEHYALVQGRFDVLGGSMGAAHGERVVRAYRRAVDERLPVVVVTASGGARMQEGMVALVQMARTAAAATRHAQAGLLSVGVYGPPTTGGVFASYAGLCDVRAAVEGATIGFAGPRVAELTTRTPLPPGSHTAESAHAAALVDAVVLADDAPAWVEACIGVRDRPLPDPGPPPVSAVGDAGAWTRVVGTRSRRRWRSMSWAAALTTSWVELHGPDRAVRAGIARLGGRRVVVIAMERGMPGPGAYRLAQRAIALAGRLGLPVVTLVDTEGADPGADSEAGGIAQEIARTLAAMAALPTPSVSVCVGEGGSGGALALAFADRLLMLPGSVFSVIRPEGAAAILDRQVSPDTVAARAEQLKLTAEDVVALGVADEVVASEDPPTVAVAVAAALADAEAGQRERRFDEATARWVR